MSEAEREVRSATAWLVARGVSYLEAARRKPWIATGLPAAGTAVGLAFALLLRPLYPAGASFLADSDSNRLPLGGALAGLASQFGVSTNKSDSPQFYADLLHNRTILLALLQTRYPAAIVNGKEPRTLGEVLGVEDVSSPRGREAGLRALSRRIKPRMNPRTSVVDFDVEAETPALAVAIANDLLTAVDSFNIRTRQLRASAQQDFFTQRVERAGTALRDAEEELRRFLVTNRAYQGSPTLKIEQERLQRTVDQRQTLYTALQQQLDQASIDAARNTPTLIVLARPAEITKPSWPKRRLLVAIGFALGLLGALVWLRLSQHALFESGVDDSWAASASRLRSLRRRVS